MSTTTNIDLAYQFLRKAKKSVTLMDIWNGIKKDVINNKSDESDTIADLYGEMVLDNKFALSSTGHWSIADGEGCQNIKAELKNLASHSKKAKNNDQVANIDEDENPEIYDDLFIEEEEDETVQFYYNKEDED